MEVLVLLTCYNHEDYIASALNSVKNQDYRNFTCFVIDDCSTDNSLSVIRDWLAEANDERFVLRARTRNIGKSKVLNQVLNTIEMQNYSYVAFLDSDDLWFSSKLGRQVKIMNSNDSLIATASEGLLIIEENYDRNAWGDLTGQQYFSDIHRFPLNTDIKQNDLFMGNCMFWSSLMVRSSDLEHVQFNTQFGRSMDWIFLLNITEKGNITVEKEALAKYRIHSTNIQTRVVGNYQLVQPRIFLLAVYGGSMNKNELMFNIELIIRDLFRIKFISRLGILALIPFFLTYCIIPKYLVKTMAKK